MLGITCSRRYKKAVFLQHTTVRLVKVMEVGSLEDPFAKVIHGVCFEYHSLVDVLDEGQA
jgi:hypothetical protein